jgi:hypothetical protein
MELIYNVGGREWVEEMRTMEESGSFTTRSEDLRIAVDKENCKKRAGDAGEDVRYA